MFAWAWAWAWVEALGVGVGCWFGCGRGSVGEGAGVDVCGCVWMCRGGSVDMGDGDGVGVGVRVRVNMGASVCVPNGWHSRVHRASFVAAGAACFVIQVVPTEPQDVCVLCVVSESMGGTPGAGVQHLFLCKCLTPPQHLRLWQHHDHAKAPTGLQTEDTRRPPARGVRPLCLRVVCVAD